MGKKVNQDIERYYFEDFCKTYPLPSGNILYGDKPDIILNSDKIIGIEVTNFYIGDGKLLSSEQRQSPIREKIIKEAHSLYKKNGGKNIEISFAFNSITNQKNLAKKIADLIKEIENSPSGSVINEVFIHIPELSFIYLKEEENEFPKWHITQGYKVFATDEERLKKIIKEKEEKSKKYKKCDLYWLLIIVNFMDFAQDQEILNIDTKSIKSEVFEKILIYKTVFRNIVEIKTQNEAIG
jgi:hypothetical protein